MKEQSHKNEMRAALKGDFERLRARLTSEEKAALDAEPRSEEDTEREAPAPEPARSSWRDRLRGNR